MRSKFGIVVSLFNPIITDKLLEGAIKQLQKANIQETDITIIRVPGAVEIPLIAQLLAQSNQYKAIISLGAVIRGETNHYDYVCDQVSQGCQKVMLDYQVPVIFGVLTTENMQQALDRVGGKEGHKGMEAADAALTMAQLVEQLMPSLD